MKYRLLILAASTLLIASSGPMSDARPSGDEAFKKLSDDFIAGYLAWRPQSGTGLGLHEYDGKVTDFSKASIDAERARLKSFDETLSALDRASLSREMSFDARILQNAIRNELFSFDDLGVYAKNPMTYAGVLDVNIYIKRNFAPLEDRVRSIIAVERTAHRIYEAARANLEDSLAKPYIETAVQIARGSADFLGGDLVTALKDMKNDSLLKEFRAVNDAAIAEVKSFADYLEKEKLPKAHGHYAIDREKYKKMLLYGEEITMEPDKILEVGLKELKREQDVFNAAARIIDPNKKPVDVYKSVQSEHPTAAKLIEESKQHLEAVRQYLIDKNIVTMPSQVRVRVEETPQYARATSTASMDTPGPFETKATEAYYYVTPVDPKWSAQEQEDWLHQFDYYTTDNVTVHEAYPGHYTQFLHLNASPVSRVRKIFGSYAFIEGWAHYTERMMTDEGYGKSADAVASAKYRLAQSGDALLRTCRLCVSIKTHCQGMNVDDATKFFMDNWYQGDKPSRQEAIRGTFDPSYLFYTLGKLQILKLREDYQTQEGKNYSLKKFHDLMLDNGMPPIRMMREMLLKDQKKWEEIL